MPRLIILPMKAIHVVAGPLIRFTLLRYGQAEAVSSRE